MVRRRELEQHFDRLSVAGVPYHLLVTVVPSHRRFSSPCHVGVNGTPPRDNAAARFHRLLPHSPLYFILVASLVFSRFTPSRKSQRSSTLEPSSRTLVRTKEGCTRWDIESSAIYIGICLIISKGIRNLLWYDRRLFDKPDWDTLHFLDTVIFHTRNVCRYPSDRFFKELLSMKNMGHNGVS